MRRRSLLAACGIGFALPAWARPADILQKLEGEHPAAYYQEAQRLFQAGQREDAVFIYYLGALRFRTHLTARPQPGSTGELPLFGALSETVGRPINEWAFGDVPTMLATLDAVMEYDREVPDRFTSPASYPEAHRQVRESMLGFRNTLEGRAEEIRRTRAANGLENR